MSRNDLARELEKQSPRFQVIVESLDKYYEAHKQYPLLLDKLNLGALPAVSVPQEHLKPSGPTYAAARDRSFFRLTYGLAHTQDSDLHAAASYFSPDRKWDFSGRVLPFAHVESRHYGGLFAKTRTTASLELTVSSLLDAAKSNASAYPCRNFWGNWIDKSLGHAQATSYDFPYLPGREARLYSPTDVGSSYMFLFRDQLYPPMTKPLSIVMAIYRSRDAKSGEWVLHQQCDSSADRPGR